MTPTDCDSCAAIRQPTEVSDSWKRAGERKRAALCPYLAVLSEWLPSLTDRVDAALKELLYQFVRKNMRTAFRV